MKQSIGIVAVLSLAAFACGDSPSAPSGVTGETWRLISWARADGQAVTIDDPSRYTVRFGDDGRIQIKSDCNSCGSSYRLTGADLAVSAVACTRVFCAPPSLDPAYADAVGRSRTVSVRDGTLVLAGDHGTLQFQP